MTDPVPTLSPSLRRAARGAALAVTIGLAGCRPSGPDAEPAGEIRGTPIQSAVSNQASTTASTKTPTNETRPTPDTEFPPAYFDRLSSYAFDPPVDLLGPITNDVAAATRQVEAMIPPAVKSLNEKKVWLKGFMLPLKVEGGLVTELLIMKDQSMCCFGTQPKINEWVSVKMKDKGVKPLMDQAVTLLGTLRVGEMRENGYLTGIYEMTGDKLGPIEE